MESHRVEMPKAENSLAEGVVHMICETRYLVVSPSAGTVRAERAAGCLLSPEAGDRVLVALTGENAWVLSVLKRAHPADAATLALPGKTTLTADRLEIEARATLKLSAPLMAFSGKLLTQSFDFLRSAAVRLVEIAVHRQGRYGKHQEETRELRELRVGRLRVESQHSARFEAENIDVKARKLLDMDAGDFVKIG
ncbi:MAG: DUF3540 domain-containing protein [Zoogloeaceae bacterium]|jgi:hypothetical protein|nr:DUF3540 domain-containing protein [Zoogloeaceae bacterium]